MMKAKRMKDATKYMLGNESYNEFKKNKQQKQL